MIIITVKKKKLLLIGKKKLLFVYISWLTVFRQLFLFHSLNTRIYILYRVRQQRQQIEILR